jgi:hypothetical protein
VEVLAEELGEDYIHSEWEMAEEEEEHMNSFVDKVEKEAYTY